MFLSFSFHLLIKMQDFRCSLKEIADLLGHMRLDTTRIYAKTDMTSLREVADMNWEGLLLFIRIYLLLLSDINIDRCTGQIPLLTHFIFQETFVRFLHILRQIGEIYK